MPQDPQKTPTSGGVDNSDAFLLRLATQLGAPVSVDTAAPKKTGTETKAETPSIGSRFYQGVKAVGKQALATAIGIPVEFVGPSVRKVVEQTGEHLDVVGGTIGESVGGPFGAGFGTAGGGAMTRLIHEAPEVPDAIRDIYRNLTQAPTTVPIAPSLSDPRKDKAAIALATAGGYQQGMARGEQDVMADAVLGAGGSELGLKGGKASARWLMKAGVGDIPQKILTKFKTDPDSIVNTLIDRGINPTKRGITKIKALLDVADAKLDQTLGPIWGRVSPAKAANRVDDVVADFSAKNTLTPDEYLGQIADTKAKFLAAHPADLTAQEAQTLKRGGYRELERLKKDAYGKIGSPEIETRKAILRGLREEIENQVDAEAAMGLHPGVNIGAVQELNKEEQRLLAAKAAIATNLLRGQKPLSVYDLGFVVHHPMTVAFSIANALNMPVEAVVARAVNEGAIKGVNSVVVRGMLSGLSGQAEAQLAEPGTPGRPFRGDRGTAGTSSSPLAPGSTSSGRSTGPLAPKTGGS